MNWSYIFLALTHNMVPKFITIVPADVLAPNGARPSAGTVLTTKLDVIFES